MKSIEDVLAFLREQVHESVRVHETAATALQRCITVIEERRRKARCIHCNEPIVPRSGKSYYRYRRGCVEQLLCTPCFAHINAGGVYFPSVDWKYVRNVKETPNAR